MGGGSSARARRGGPKSGSKGRSGPSWWSRSPARPVESRSRACSKVPSGRPSRASRSASSGWPGTRSRSPSGEPGRRWHGRARLGLVPLSVAFNVLTPEPAEVDLHCLAELRPIRGGDPIWRARVAGGRRHRRPRTRPSTRWRSPPGGPKGLTSSKSRRPGSRWADPAGTPAGPVGPPPSEPLADHLGDPPPDPGDRRPRSRSATPPSKAEGPRAGVEVDAIDLARSLGTSPDSASGRSPLDGPGRASWTVPEVALVDPSLRDRLRKAGSTGPWPTRSTPRPGRPDRPGLVGGRPPGDASRTAPPADRDGLGRASRGARRGDGGRRRRPGVGGGSCSTPAPRARRSSKAAVPTRLFLAGLARLGGAGAGPGQPRGPAVPSRSARSS